MNRKVCCIFFVVFLVSSVIFGLRFIFNYDCVNLYWILFIYLVDLGFIVCKNFEEIFFFKSFFILGLVYV